MATHLGFLRAINLGATRKFPKSDIVAATEAAGFTGVATYINTGNVRFDTVMRSRARIEAALEAAYLADRGFEVPTVVFTRTELREVVADAGEVAAGLPGGTHYVSLLKHEPDPDLVRQLEEVSTDDGLVRVRGRAVHLLVTDPYHQSRLTNATVEGRLGVATNRNLNVLRALVDKWC